MASKNVQGNGNQVVATQEEENIKMMLNFRVENAIREILTQEITHYCRNLSDDDDELEEIKSYPYMLLRVNLKSYYFHDDDYIDSKVGGLVIDALENIDYGTYFYVYPLGYEYMGDNEYVADVLVFASEAQLEDWKNELSKKGTSLIDHIENELIEELYEYDKKSTAKVERIDPRSFIYV